MRSFKHWTRRYIWDRIQVIIDERIHPDSPWLTRDMVKILSSWIQNSDCGLEWGSGRSTLWFAKRCGSLISIEHDKTWYDKIRSQMERENIHNVDYRLVKGEPEYISVARSLANCSLDFCLVDGIARDECALAVLPLLRPGGIMILDNSNWYLPSNSRSPNSRRIQTGPASNAWQEFLNEVKEWRYIWTSNGVCDTTFWVKPGGERSILEQR
jgi:hypothetical protein